MTDDTEEARDYLDEALRIAAGQSRLLAERAHVEALATDRARMFDRALHAEMNYNAALRELDAAFPGSKWAELLAARSMVPA